MLQRARRLSACLIAIVAFVGGRGGLSADQKPNSDISHWSLVSRPALGPDGTIYVLGSVGDVHHPDDPERSGGSIYGPGGNYLYAVKPDGTHRWSFTLGGSEIHELFPPKIGPSGGSVYVADNHNLYAVGSNGARKWKFAFAGEPSWLDFGSDGTVYLCASNLLYALKADGSLKWKKSTQTAPMVGPDGAAYITAGNLLYAINSNGIQKWSLAVGKGPIRALRSPNLKSVSPWAIYVVGSDNLYAVAPNGSEKWKFPFTGSPDSLQFAPDGTIHFCSGNVLYALKADGTVKWKFDAPSEIKGPHVGPDGAVYVEAAETSTGMLYAVKPDGSLKWQSPWEEPAYSEDVLEVGPDGSVYVEEWIGNWGAEMVAIDREGSEKWCFGKGQFGLAFGADGTIYVGDSLSGSVCCPPTGTLYALTPSGEQNWRFERLCAGNGSGCPDN